MRQYLLFKKEPYSHECKGIVVLYLLSTYFFRQRPIQKKHLIFKTNQSAGDMVVFFKKSCGAVYDIFRGGRPQTCPVAPLPVPTFSASGRTLFVNWKAGKNWECVALSYGKREFGVFKMQLSF